MRETAALPTARWSAMTTPGDGACPAPATAAAAPRPARSGAGAAGAGEATCGSGPARSASRSIRSIIAAQGSRPQGRIGPAFEHARASERHAQDHVEQERQLEVAEREARDRDPPAALAGAGDLSQRDV